MVIDTYEHGIHAWRNINPSPPGLGQRCHHILEERMTQKVPTRTAQAPLSVAAGRRKILKAGAAIAAGGATLGFPMISKGQAAGPISMRWQSTWPSKDIFHEFALD